MRLGTGCSHVSSHCLGKAYEKFTKLECLLGLQQQGWQQATPKTLCDITADSEKLYHHTLSKSRWYFVCLLSSSEVLRKLAIDAACLPSIRHKMPETYYKVCVCASLMYVNVQIYVGIERVVERNQT